MPSRQSAPQTWLGVETGAEPVGNHLDRVRRHLGHVVGARGQRVPVGDEEEAVELVLDPDPVGERAEGVSEVKLAGWPQAREHARLLHRARVASQTLAVRMNT